MPIIETNNPVLTTIVNIGGADTENNDCEKNMTEVVIQHQSKINTFQTAHTLPKTHNNIPSNAVLPSQTNIQHQEEANSFCQDHNSSTGSTIAGKNPSWRSWIAAANTMMGTSIVVFPVIFLQNGILTSFITMLVVGFFLYKTCSYYLTYKLPTEMDSYQTIQRILGFKWKIVYNVCNAILLYLVQIIYFLLLASFLFPCLKLLLQDGFGVSVAERDESTFSKFSFQWVALITTFILFLLLAKRDLTFIMKVTQFGLLTVIIVVIYVLIRFGQASPSTIDSDEIPIFTSNILDIAGIFILSFQIHSVIVPILKDNANQNKVKRDLSVIYIITFTVYSIVSLFGVFAIAGRKAVSGYSGDTILEFYQDSDILNICVRLGLCVYIIGVYPIIVYASRVNFFSILQKEQQNAETEQQQPSYKIYLMTNVVYCGSALLAVLININLNLVMSVAGYTVSFFTVILIPILIRIKGAQLLKKNSQISEVKSHSIINQDHIQQIPEILKQSIQNANIPTEQQL